MNSVNTPLLSVTGMSVRYGKSAALHNFDLRLAAGELVSVIGPNGAGKSSLLNGIMGCLPANGFATGKVLIGGEDVSLLPIERRVLHGMALVPESRELFTSMTIEDNLVLGAYLRRRLGREDREAQLAYVFSIFPRLAERRHQVAGTLSGGERQMLVIGRALMSRPRILMLDEPSLGLAPMVMNEVFNVITNLRDQGLGILLVEQNSRAALKVSDYAYVLELGTVSLQGRASEVMQNPKVIEAYLGRAEEEAL